MESQELEQQRDHHMLQRHENCGILFYITTKNKNILKKTKQFKFF